MNVVIFYHSINKSIKKNICSVKNKRCKVTTMMLKQKIHYICHEQPQRQNKPRAYLPCLALPDKKTRRTQDSLRLSHRQRREIVFVFQMVCRRCQQNPTFSDQKSLKTEHHQYHQLNTVLCM